MTDKEMLDKLYSGISGHAWLLLWGTVFLREEELGDGVMTLADDLGVPIDELNQASIRECDRREELVSVNTAQDRTILFDLLPLSTPAFRSYELRFQIVAVPGQKYYGATRKMLLKNTDSIVFVANSATDRWRENLQSMKEMTEYLLDQGIEPSTIPLVFQYNKRDLPDTTDMKIMERGLNARSAPSFTSVATEGKGVLETFAAALERTMTELATRYKIGKGLADARSAKEWACERSVCVCRNCRTKRRAGRRPGSDRRPREVTRRSSSGRQCTFSLRQRR